MVPAEYEGEITAIKSGSYTLDETVATLKTANGTVNLTMLQRWPVRRGRPYKEKIAPDRAHGNWPARNRHVLPDRARRRGGGARPVRQRQDRGSASACKVG